MIALFDGNVIGKTLVGASAALLAVFLVLAVAWILPPSGAELDPDAGGPSVSSDVPQLEQPKPIEQYAEIINRPVFNESRQPVIGGEFPDGDEEELAGAQDVEAPDVELAGVVITPDVRVATLRVKGEDVSLMALEGQPLEGDFGSWRVSRVEPRSAVLESASGDQVRLELQIHDAMIDAPEPPPPGASDDAGEQADNVARNDAPMSRAEEIRQRIAERREELRRAAEEGAEPTEPARPSYQQAIEALMKGTQKDTQENDESEQ